MRQTAINALAQLRAELSASPAIEAAANQAAAAVPAPRRLRPGGPSGVERSDRETW
jgi:hypothetical protein